MSTVEPLHLNLTWLPRLFMALEMEFYTYWERE